MSFDDIGYGILAQAHLAPDQAIAASDRDERHHLRRETVGFRPLPGLTAQAFAACLCGSDAGADALLDDAETLARWLESQVSALEHRSDRLLVAARERCRSLGIEPPSPDRLDRLVRSVVHRHEEALCAAVLTRLPAETAAGLDALLTAPAADATSGEAGRAPLLALRAGSGQASLQSVGEEADKLARIRALALPADLFADLPSKVLLAYRRRVAAEELHELRRHPAALRLTLLAAFCHVRGPEITDALVDLLIATVHRIGSRIGSTSGPRSATRNGILCAIRPLMKCTSLDSRSSLATAIGQENRKLRRASTKAAASCGRRSSASDPLPVSTSVNS